MPEFINPWYNVKYTDSKEVFIFDEKPAYTIGDYAIYKMYNKSFIHTYKNTAILWLAGVNKELLNALHDGVVFTKYPQKFLYDRAVEIITKFNLGEKDETV